MQCHRYLIILVVSFFQVLNLIPKEADGEPFEEALARVRRCIGGGTSADNAGSDSDLEVVADSVTLNIRCPVSCSLSFLRFIVRGNKKYK